jgi:hypothetical protein
VFIYILQWIICIYNPVGEEKNSVFGHSTKTVGCRDRFELAHRNERLSCLENMHAISERCRHVHKTPKIRLKTCVFL